MPIRLRGVNRAGLEYALPLDGDFLAGAAITRDEIESIVRGWGANVLRVPFNQSRVLRGSCGLPPEAYLDALDTIIGWSAESGTYTILDLQWRDDETAFGLLADGSPNRVPPLPDPAAIDVWRVLARRYRDEPAVLFDLFNEPHDPIHYATDPHRTDLNPLWTINDDGAIEASGERTVSMRDWQRWARMLVRTIRAEESDALIFVSGIDWAYDLRGIPLCDSESSGVPLGGIVYSTHVYPWRGGSSRWTSWSTLRGAQPTWRRAFGDLASKVPVFAGEWGGVDAHVEWGAALCRYMDRLGMGWTAWSWADHPHLVRCTLIAGIKATAFGDIVRRSLAD